MRANPGGEIDPKDVVGRDSLIEQLWSVLESQSAILVAERRMGKSSIVKKMRSEPKSGKKLIYRDVEGIRTPLEFVERVYQDSEAHYPTLFKGRGAIRKMFKGLAGAEVAGFFRFPEAAASDWKNLLETAIADLSAHLEGTSAILVWDELPLMLQKITRAAGPDTAMDLLDTLRGLRQTHSGIRMVFTGSIGLHHVVADLKAAGHMNDATNDMRLFEIPELSDVDAADLAARLLEGERLHADDRAATIAALVAQSNAIPFYIHHVIASVKARGAMPSAALVYSIVAEAMVSPQDAWHLQHFRDRLTSYYGDERLPVVLKVLDEVAASETALGFNEILRICSSMGGEQSGFTKRVVDGDAESLRALLELLLRDHYLQQVPDTGHYLFRFQIIQRWWCLRRGLTR